MIFDRLMYNEDRTRTFVPANVEGASAVKSPGFWNSTKTIICFSMGAWLVLFFFLSGDWSTPKKVITIILTIIAFFFIIRFAILSEGYYKKVYSRLLKYKGTTSAIFWGSVFTNETENGCSVCFADGSYGCFVRLKRGSIVGQPEDYMESCKDVFSDFLKACNAADYTVTIIKTSENAGKDKRLDDLVQKVKDERNKGLKEILELNTSYMRAVTDVSYYQTDTILLTTTNGLKLNDIVFDSLNLTSILLKGAYLERHVMNEGEIIDLHQSLNCVNYFDIVTARTELELSSDRKAGTTRQFYIKSFKLKNGNEYELTPAQQRRLGEIYNMYVRDKGKKLDVVSLLTNPNGVQQPQTTQSKV